MHEVKKNRYATVAIVPFADEPDVAAFFADLN
jgi:hypothetical protein